MDEMAKPPIDAPIDDRTADRILSGSVSPDDAPPGYEQVARVVRAAQAPASGAELANEQSVVSMAVAAISNPVQAPLGPGSHRRRRMVSKLATVRAAAITAAAVLGAGAAAAAATGSLPTQTSNSASHGSGHNTTGSDPTSTTSTTTGSGNTTQANPNLNSTNPLNLPTTGPANFHAVIGLCRAFLAHNSNTSPGGGSTATPENNSTAFTDLRKDAGNGTEASVAATVAWCNTYLARFSPGNSGPAQNNPAQNGTAPSRKPASPGNSGTHSSNGVNPASHSGGSAGASNPNSAGGGTSPNAGGPAKAGGH